MCITVYESMCKPYIKAELKIVDNNNFINGLNLRGAEPVNFSIDDGNGGIYDCTQHILSIQGEEQNKSLRSMSYTIITAGPSFFYDQANLVKQADKNVPGTTVAAQIHNEYVGGDAGLKVLVPSMGLISKDEYGGYQTENKHPFKAIEDVLASVTYGGYKTGSTVYFRNAKSYVIGPLEAVFKMMGSNVTVIQKSTWGSDWHHVFSATNAIIAAKTVIDEEKTARASAAASAAAAKGSSNPWDISLGKEMFPMAISITGSVGATQASRFVRSKDGGIINVRQLDSRRTEPSTDPGMNAPLENAFVAKVADSVNYLIKVPFNSGVKATVGEGITAKLMPPVGDQSSGAQNVGGNMLVADLQHECWFDKREVQATTTMRCVKLGS